MESSELKRLERKRDALLQDARQSEERALLHKAGMQEQMEARERARRRFAEAKRLVMQSSSGRGSLVALRQEHEQMSRLKKDAAIFKDSEAVLSKKQAVQDKLAQMLIRQRTRAEKIGDLVAGALAERKQRNEAAQLAESVEARLRQRPKIVLGREAEASNKIWKAEKDLLSNDAAFRRDEGTALLANDLLPVAEVQPGSGTLPPFNEGGSQQQRSGGQLPMPEMPQSNTSQQGYGWLAAQIAERIELLRSWESGDQTGLDISYTTQSGRPLRIRVSRSDAGYISVELEATRKQDAAFVRQEQAALETALAKAGMGTARVICRMSALPGGRHG